MRVPVAASRNTPSPALPKSSVPVTSVPTKQVSIAVFAAFDTRMPCSGNELTTRPRTLTPSASMRSPEAPAGAEPPSSSTISVGGHAAQTAPLCVQPSIVTPAGTGGSSLSR